MPLSDPEHRFLASKGLVISPPHDVAQALLRSRYPQLQSMQIAHHPVIAIRIERTISWGNLSALV